MPEDARKLDGGPSGATANLESALGLDTEGQHGLDALAGASGGVLRCRPVVEVQVLRDGGVIIVHGLPNARCIVRRRRGLGLDRLRGLRIHRRGPALPEGEVLLAALEFPSGLRLGIGQVHGGPHGFKPLLQHRGQHILTVGGILGDVGRCSPLVLCADNEHTAGLQKPVHVAQHPNGVAAGAERARLGANDEVVVLEFVRVDGREIRCLEEAQVLGRRADSAELLGGELALLHMLALEVIHPA
mmetsp:Transcript_122711/g.352503  ORF Transcript_122711/g.352503 Transcript_122711/m.352503 type:complete len:244 (+) Transcript_122711:891-1622(+)